MGSRLQQVLGTVRAMGASAALGRAGRLAREGRPAEALAETTRLLDGLVVWPGGSVNPVALSVFLGASRLQIELAHELGRTEIVRPTAERALAAFDELRAHRRAHDVGPEVHVDGSLGRTEVWLREQLARVA